MAFVSHGRSGLAFVFIAAVWATNADNFFPPKAFSGHTQIIQDNAIGSWKRLGPACEIILVGDDPGVAEAAIRHGVRHEPSVARNEFGTPVLSDIFSRMNRLANYPVLALVNADVILLEDFLSAVDVVVRSRKKFMVIASRFNCRIDRPLSFERGWDAELGKKARAENRMYPAAGSDIFVYPRGLFDAVPPFAIGRGYWDNWLMYEARRTGADLVDVTAAATTVHQLHSYETVAGLSSQDSGDRHVYETKEGQQNLEMAGGRGQLYTAFDANEIMGSDRRLHSTTWNPLLIRRRIKAWLRRHIQVFLSRTPNNPL